jgi:hypothetical protein
VGVTRTCRGSGPEVCFTYRSLADFLEHSVCFVFGLLFA